MVDQNEFIFFQFLKIANKKTNQNGASIIFIWFRRESLTCANTALAIVATILKAQKKCVCMCLASTQEKFSIFPEFVCIQFAAAQHTYSCNHFNQANNITKNPGCMRIIFCAVVHTCILQEECNYSFEASASLKMFSIRDVGICCVPVQNCVSLYTIFILPPMHLLPWCLCFLKNYICTRYSACIFGQCNAAMFVRRKRRKIIISFVKSSTFHVRSCVWKMKARQVRSNCVHRREIETERLLLAIC